MKNSDVFTVSFFSEKYRKALGYMGSHSGRNEDKAAVAGLTPLPVDNSVMFKEASITFVCRKVYQHQFVKEGMVKLNYMCNKGKNRRRKSFGLVFILIWSYRLKGRY